MKPGTHVMHQIDVTDHLWIRMPDGVQLAARLWLPKGARSAPVPALLEYIPYRKADMVRARDERNHPFFAAHGYACLRVDMRGSGDSEGHMPDMYSEHELSDARHVIEWIAAQSWCDGKVGMFGTSWGGTASLQANIEAPDALKAVIAVCATHDRYEDDIHHMGGCLLTDTFEWGATLPAILGSPPTPNVGPHWKDLWKERLKRLTFPVEAWVRHEARGEYWRHGSVIHQADRLSRPILAIGGWSDRYSNSVISLLSARPDLVWGVVGPWGHHYPDQGHPGPAMGFQQLSLEWWDHWLRPGAKKPNWPRLRTWLREFDPPVDAIDARNGGWIEADAPERCAEPKILYLDDKQLSATNSDVNGGWNLPTNLSVGLAAGDTGYFGRFGGLPLDQGSDDELSQVFDSEPLEQDVVLIGGAIARLQIGTQAQPRQVALRLNDVAPDGQSARVVMAVRNLALNENLDAPIAPLPNIQEVDVSFPTTAYRFRKGHRIRLALATSAWPLVWPSSEMGGVELKHGSLVLPLHRGQPKDLQTPLPSPLVLPEIKTHRVLSDPPLERFFNHNESGEYISSWSQPFTEVRYNETGTDFGFETSAEHRIAPGKPESAFSTIEHRARYRRIDGTAQIRCRITARSNVNTYFIEGFFSADWDHEKLAEHRWNFSIPRSHS